MATTRGEQQRESEYLDQLAAFVHEQSHALKLLGNDVDELSFLMRDLKWMVAQQGDQLDVFEGEVSIAKENLEACAQELMEACLAKTGSAPDPLSTDEISSPYSKWRFWKHVFLLGFPATDVFYMSYLCYENYKLNRLYEQLKLPKRANLHRLFLGLSTYEQLAEQARDEAAAREAAAPDRIERLRRSTRITVGPNKSCIHYLQTRCDAMIGKTVADALQSEFTLANGQSRRYRRDDLAFDIKTGRLCLDVTATAASAVSGEKATQVHLAAFMAMY
jgi:hypothetical protein